MFGEILSIAVAEMVCKVDKGTLEAVADTMIVDVEISEVAAVCVELLASTRVGDADNALAAFDDSVIGATVLLENAC